MMGSRILTLEIESGWEFNELLEVGDLATGMEFTSYNENQVYSLSLSNKTTEVQDEPVDRSFANNLVSIRKLRMTRA